MEIGYNKIKFIPIALILIASCKSVSNDISFPKNETEFAQPIAKPLKLLRPVKIKWNIIGPKKINPIIQTQIDFAKLPSQQFDTDGFKSFLEPITQTKVNWDRLPFDSFSLLKLPHEKFKFRVSILGKPTVNKRKIPLRYENGRSNMFLIDDIPGQMIRSMVFDNKCILWAAVYDRGICKLDGENVTVYDRKQGLESLMINRMCEDKQGQMWIGTQNNGVEVLDLRGGIIKHITTKEGLAGNNIWGLISDKQGQIWIGILGGGVDIVNEKTGIIKHLNNSNGLSDNYVRSFLEESNGDIWIGTGSGIDIVNINAGNIKHVNKSTGISDNNIECLLEKSENEIWVGTRNGVNIIDKKAGEIRLLGTRQGLKSNYIRDIFKDQYQQIWICELEGGPDIINNQEVYYKHLHLKGLQGNWDASIIIGGNRDVIWIGTATNGVIKYDVSESVEFLNSDHFKDVKINYFYGLLEDSHRQIWMGTDSGTLIINFESNTVKYLKIDDEVLCLLEDSFGKIWMGTSNKGLYILDPISGLMRNIRKEHGLSSDTVLSVFEDSQHCIWVGNYSGGINRIDLQLKSISLLNTGDDLRQISIYDFLEDSNGQIWISTVGAGIFIINQKSGIFRRFIDTLDLNITTSITEDNLNRIWVGQFGKGLSMIVPKDSLITNFTTKEGLAENFVVSIKSSKGEIFALTTGGLTSIKASASGAKGIECWNLRTYGISNGFTNLRNDAIYPSILRKSGEFWWGMRDHINIMKINNYDTILPITQLTGIDIQNKLLDFVDNKRLNIQLGKTDSFLNPTKDHSGQKHSFSGYLDSLNQSGITWDDVVSPYNIPINLRLPYYMNFVAFHFISDQSDISDKVVFRYYLKGLDKRWSDISSKTESQNYANLSPGDYSFSVSSRGFNGNWSKPSEFSFSILPPWWKTWLSYLFYLIFALSIVYLMYRNHLHRLHTRQKNEIKVAIQTQEDERKRISRDLHDDIGTKLSALKLFLSSLEEKAMASNNKEIESMAQISEQYIKEVVNDLRQLLMNLSPLVLEEFGYVVAVEGLANKINETNVIHFTLNVFGFKQRLQKEYELYLYRITQELISNILKHAGAKNISLQVGIRDEKIILMMTDDGKGFKVNEQNGGYGLKNLETRTKIMSGKMIIESNPGSGTNVLIEIPYNVS